MEILVINSGSSTIKFQIIEPETEKVLIKGLCDAIGLDNSRIEYSVNDNKKEISVSLKSHKDAIEEILKIILEEKIVEKITDIEAIAHRAVHGGERFVKPIIVTNEVIEEMERLNELAPLHNPPNVLGMKVFMELAPNVLQVAIFDTAFHSTLKEDAFIYPIPLEYYEKYRIRKYGFHGTSHHFIALECAKFLDKDILDLKIITCHLGNGASICAINKGISVDTSMGFTPLEGIMMGTRCGDIDPAIPLFLEKKEALNPQEVDTILNKKSGLLGLSGISQDMRVVKEEELKGNQKARLARDIYARRVKKYIGSYFAIMNGCDAICFSGGVGENEPLIRERMLSDLENLGVVLDREANLKNSWKINSADSKVSLFVIKTNEELMIAKQAKGVINKR